MVPVLPHSSFHITFSVEWQHTASGQGLVQALASPAVPVHFSTCCPSNFLSQPSPKSMALV